MTTSDPMGIIADARLTARLVSALYTEAMLLADEARSYFDDGGRDERETLPPLTRVVFSCESLKVTTRLMHVIAWLLMRRAVDAGEMTERQARVAARRLGPAADSDAAALLALPPAAQALVTASRDLYGRVARLEQDLHAPALPPSPARTLQSRLERAF